MALVAKKFRIPTWLIVTVVAFLLFFFAGFLSVLFRELPAAAQPAAVETRFKPQIEFLKELAGSHPGDELHSKAWWSRVEEHADLFSDPAILGASVYIRHESSATVSVTVKAYEAPEESMLESWVKTLMDCATFPDVDQPVVRHWYAGGKRFLRLDNLFLDAKGKRRGYRLILDLDLLEGE